MWRDRCDACFALCRWERDQLTRCRRSRCCGAALSWPNIARARIRQPRQNHERPSGRRRSRTGGRLRVSPLTRSRATLKFCRCQPWAAANFVPPPGLYLVTINPTTIRRAVRHITALPAHRVAERGLPRAGKARRCAPPIPAAPSSVPRVGVTASRREVRPMGY
jgi:hypothetical protein